MAPRNSSRKIRAVLRKLLCVFSAVSFLNMLPTKVFASPASESQVATYTSIGALTVCFLNALDVDLDKSLQASSTALMRTIVDQHNSQIDTSNLERPPTEAEIREAFVIQLTTLIVEYCGDKFSGNNKKELDRILDIIKSRFTPSPLEG